MENRKNVKVILRRLKRKKPALSGLEETINGKVLLDRGFAGNAADFLMPDGDNRAGDNY
jgi:hypothetical protein